MSDAPKHNPPCRYCGSRGTTETVKRLHGEVYWTCDEHSPTGANADIGITPSQWKAIGFWGQQIRVIAGM